MEKATPTLVSGQPKLQRRAPFATRQLGQGKDNNANKDGRWNGTRAAAYVHSSGSSFSLHHSVTNKLELCQYLLARGIQTSTASSAIEAPSEIFALSATIICFGRLKQPFPSEDPRRVRACSSTRTANQMQSLVNACMYSTCSAARVRQVTVRSRVSRTDTQQ